MTRKLFIIGFVIVLVLFVGANVYSYHQVNPCCDGVAPFGFPFELGEFGGFVGYTSFNLIGTVANVIVAVGAGVALGWLFAKLSPLILSFVRSSLTRLLSWHAQTRL